jgi:hypothetical protein
MLTKVIGTPTVITMSGTAQTVSITTNEFGTVLGQSNLRLPATKIRIATNSQPAYVSFDGTTATTTTSVLIPANSSEHFKLNINTVSTTTNSIIVKSAVTATISVLQAGTAGILSVVAVA